MLAVCLIYRVAGWRCFQGGFAWRTYPGLKPISANLIAVCFLVPEGLHESSPTPQSLRRDRRRWLRKPLAIGRAVVCEGGLARSAGNT